MLPFAAFRRLWLAAGWLAVLVAVASIPWMWGFEYKDGDSDLYAVISAQLGKLPTSQWLSPHWPVPSYKSGLFEEHMAFFFWPPAVLCALGVPAVPATLACNFLYLLGIFALCHHLAGHFFPAPHSGALAVAAWIFSYAGIQYVIRNNHETPVALGVVAAVWGLVQTQRHTAYAAVAVLASMLCVAMKGVVGIVVLPALAAWWWFVRRDRRGALTVVACALGVAVFLWVHDLAFQAANGHSFLGAYLDIHMGYAAAREQASALHKLSNLVYYSGAAVWWAFPGSALLLWFMVTHRRTPWPPALVATLWTVAVYVTFFSLFDRRASRYIFGVHPLLAMCAGGVLATHGGALLTRFRRLLPHLQPLLMASTLVVVLLRVYVHNNHYRFYSPNNPRRAVPTADGGAPTADAP